MPTRLGIPILAALVVSLGVFVWYTSQSLPPVVASHFAPAGAADGFTPRASYIGLMIGLVLGIPLLVAVLPALLAGRGSASFNIPNRDYWLAPERKARTVAFVRAHGFWLAGAVALFLAYTHWLVVRANELQPPVLSGSGLFAGLVAFLVAVAAWLVALFARFRVRD